MKWVNISVVFISYLLVMFIGSLQNQGSLNRGLSNRDATFVEHLNTVLHVSAISSVKVRGTIHCAFICLREFLCLSFNVETTPDANGFYECQPLANDKYNSSNNLKSNKEFNHHSLVTPCEGRPCENGGKCHPYYATHGYTCICATGFVGINCQMEGLSCGDIAGKYREVDGSYELHVHHTIFKVYCDMTIDNQGWTLIARFSNNDTKNWMKNSGEYWYDRKSAVGQTTNPTDNTDMISPAFWSVIGTEFKVTRSDDSNHTALLHTTGNCLGGQTFRSKLTSYGDFRNSKVWANHQCLGSCEVQYGGQYKETDGFEASECDGEIQNRTKIGFWCDYTDSKDYGDGAVLTIGGVGNSCSRADHGIGITQADGASFAHDKHAVVSPFERDYDFGNSAFNFSFTIPPYSLNIWVR